MKQLPFFRMFSLVMIPFTFLVMFSCSTTWATKAGVDLQKVESVYIGWIDLDEKMWGYHEYETKKDWTNTIARLNSAFIAKLDSMYLPGHKVTGASSKDSSPKNSHDLHILFSDVKIDPNYQILKVTLTFINGDSGNTLFKVRNEEFPCHRIGFEQFLTGSLEKLGENLATELTSN